MPSNIAHMLIAHKALKKLGEKEKYAKFADMLNDASKVRSYKAYMNLGSMGPDLYYYLNLSKSIKESITEAAGVTLWSYNLHSQRPNEFPLNLVKVIFSDVIRGKKGKVKLDKTDISKLAYIAGHLCHIAADQIIHPIVNKAAGPYYRSKANRSKHRECEIFQDYFLYQEVYRLEKKSGPVYDFFKQPFNKWADCVPGRTSRNSKDWFRHFMQRGFMETYGMCPSENDIENSADNLLLVLRACLKFGPYKVAAKQYKKDRKKSPMYNQYIKELEYIKYYYDAVELAAVYLAALYEVYSILESGKDFTGRHKNRFLKIVSNADLSCPLQQQILKKSRNALAKK